MYDPRVLIHFKRRISGLVSWMNEMEAESLYRSGRQGRKRYLNGKGIPHLPTVLEWHLQRRLAVKLGKIKR